MQTDLFGGYVIDTSALIELWREHYAPDVFKTLWVNNLSNLISRGEFIAPKQVLEELQRRDDELLLWAKTRMRKAFITINTKEQIQWIQKVTNDFGEKLIDPESEINADIYVIALAGAKNWTAITSEREKSYDGRKRVGIPHVCKIYKIKCITLMEFFREKNWTF